MTATAAPIAITVSLGSFVRESASYDQWASTEECKDHGRQTIRRTSELPSMTGSGYDHSAVLSCGCRVEL